MRRFPIGVSSSFLIFFFFLVLPSNYAVTFFSGTDTDLVVTDHHKRLRKRLLYLLTTTKGLTHNVVFDRFKANHGLGIQHHVNHDKINLSDKSKNHCNHAQSIN